MSLKRKSLGDKVVLAKIPREEYTRFQQNCELNGETINSAMKRMIFSEIDKPVFPRIAAKSIFEYNKRKDNFAWNVISDEGTFFEIDQDMPANALEQLFEAVSQALEERNLKIRRKTEGSVSLPSKLLRHSK